MVGVTIRNIQITTINIRIETRDVTGWLKFMG